VSESIWQEKWEARWKSERMNEEAKGNEGSKLEKSVLSAGKDLALNRNDVVDECATEVDRVRQH